LAVGGAANDRSTASVSMFPTLIDYNRTVQIIASNVVVRVGTEAFETECRD
jgi:hypothetical protein